MNGEPKGPGNGRGNRAESDEKIGNVQPDMTPRSEGGEDSLENASPTDNRADEKVIVNEQRESKAVNIPSQTAVNASEQTGSDEEVI